MTLTRSKRIAEEPLLTLSAAKVPKKRKIAKNVGNTSLTRNIEVAPEKTAPVNYVENVLQESRSSSSQHKCAPSCSGPRSKCPVDDVEEDDILNTSDQNENDIDLSAEIESIDGDDGMHFEASEINEDDFEENLQPSKAKRSKNLEYIFIESFENKNDLDEFWNEKEFGELFNHHLERASKTGSEDIFRCKFYSKSGFTTLD